MRSLALLACLTLVAPSPARQERPRFSSQSDLVVLHAMVEDHRGAAVPGLQRDDFIVYEDNRPQPVSFFSTTDAPATIGLLIDNSTSMATKRERVIAAAVQFAELSNPEDEVFVLAFNEEVRLAWAPRVLIESDLSVLRASLMNRISARGMTALYDAVASGIERLSRGKHARQAMVIVSDGSDNASAISMEDMMARTDAGGAMIYTVVLTDPVDRVNPKVMKRLSTSTGGESFVPRRFEDVSAALEHIARDIRATYTLGFVPSNATRDGSMRKLRVSARGADGRTLKVRTRGGYVAR